MDDRVGAPAPREAWLRRRVTLRVVDAHEAVGFVVQTSSEKAIQYRGKGPEDYACGLCGSLLAVGVTGGMFRSFIFSCGCGALNQVA